MRHIQWVKAIVGVTRSLRVRFRSVFRFVAANLLLSPEGSLGPLGILYPPKYTIHYCFLKSDPVPTFLGCTKTCGHISSQLRDSPMEFSRELAINPLLGEFAAEMLKPRAKAGRPPQDSGGVGNGPSH